MPKTINQSIRERFEANMLDGDSIEACGGAMISAEAVLEYLNSEIPLLLSSARVDLIRAVEESLPEEKDGQCVKPEYYESSGWKERDTGFNQCLATIKKSLADMK